MWKRGKPSKLSVSAAQTSCSSLHFCGERCGQPVQFFTSGHHECGRSCYQHFHTPNNNNHSFKLPRVLYSYLGVWITACRERSLSQDGLLVSKALVAGGHLCPYFTTHHQYPISTPSAPTAPVGTDTCQCRRTSASIPRLSLTHPKKFFFDMDLRQQVPRHLRFPRRGEPR